MAQERGRDRGPTRLSGPRAECEDDELEGIREADGEELGEQVVQEAPLAEAEGADVGAGGLGARAGVELPLGDRAAESAGRRGEKCSIL